MGPSPYDLHVLAFLRWAIENQSLRGRLKEEMIRHWDFLEADPKKGLQYLLRFQGDNEPTMLAEKTTQSGEPRESQLDDSGRVPGTHDGRSPTELSTLVETVRRVYRRDRDIPRGVQGITPAELTGLRPRRALTSQQRITQLSPVPAFQIGINPFAMSPLQAD